MLRSNSKSLGNHVVKKKKGCSGKDLQKRKVLSFKFCAQLAVVQNTAPSRTSD